jgi:tRNA pseudouridine38-40 synthase
VPKAPPLGLLLEAPQFGAYNRRITEGSNGIQGGGRDLVDWDLYRKEIDEFKFKWIYDRLRQDELETNV